MPGLQRIRGFDPHVHESLLTCLDLCKHSNHLREVNPKLDNLQLQKYLPVAFKISIELIITIAP